MASSSAAGGTALQVAPINAQLDKLWAPEVRPMCLHACSAWGRQCLCTSQPPKLACSHTPLQMLAYDVETVPCFVLLQPDGEGRQCWHACAATQVSLWLGLWFGLLSSTSTSERVHTNVPQGELCARRPHPVAGSRWRRRLRKWWSMQAASSSSSQLARGKVLQQESMGQLVGCLAVQCSCGAAHSGSKSEQCCALFLLAAGASERLLQQSSW